MFGIKKKLNALMPGEGARGALQNVLTVEWSGHKTVLVEVPTAGPTRSNEVEMSGLGEGDYGRLIDDEEDPVYMNQSRGYFDQPRSQRAYDDETPPPLPPKPTERYDHRSASFHGAVQAKPGVGRDRAHSHNPFDSIHDHDDLLDFETRRLARQTQHLSYGGGPARQQTSQRDQGLFENDHRGWESFTDSRGRSGKAVPDPWAGRGWGTGNGQGQTSPTNSTSTTHSETVQQMDDPFRN